MSVQVPNGVVDVLVPDEAEATRLAKRYLSYFQGPLAHWSAPDQRALRHVVPENRVRVYDMRAVVAGLADEGPVLELRRGFGAGLITALVRIEGRIATRASFPVINAVLARIPGALPRRTASRCPTSRAAKQRTARELSALLTAAGFDLDAVIDTPGARRIVQARPF